MASSIAPPGASSSSSTQLYNTIKQVERSRINPVTMLLVDPSVLSSTPIWSPWWPTDGYRELQFIASLTAYQGSSVAAAGFKMYLQTEDPRLANVLSPLFAAGANYKTPSVTAIAGGTGAVVYPVIADITNAGAQSAIVDFTVATAGTGYSNGNALTITAPLSGTTTATVSTVNGSGGILTITLSSSGAYDPTPVLTYVGGGGTVSGSANYVRLANQKVQDVWFPSGPAATNVASANAYGSGFTQAPVARLSGGTAVSSTAIHPAQLVAGITIPGGSSTGGITWTSLASGALLAGAYVPNGTATITDPGNEIGPVTSLSTPSSAVIVLSSGVGSKFRVGVAATTGWPTPVADGLSVVMLMKN